MVPVFNPAPGPVTYDSDGHIVAGRSRVVADETDPETARLIEKRYLIAGDVIESPVASLAKTSVLGSPPVEPPADTPAAE